MNIAVPSRVNTMTISGTNQRALNHHLSYIQRLVEKGGPEPHEYEEHLRWYDALTEKIWNKEIRSQDIDLMRNAFGSSYLTPKTIQGLMYVKPYGYAGDFYMIEKLYNEHISSDKNFEKWDKFTQAQAAPKAVRNRKQYFKSMLKEKCTSFSKSIKVLNLASGPCRDIYEFLQEIPGQNIQFHCVDLDKHSVVYAQKLLGSFCKDHVRFTVQNIFKFNPTEKYDLLWSAGLFDYFHDEAFVYLLRKLVNHIKPGGEMTIGNFHPNNPTKNYMEVFGQWYLNYRDEANLIQLGSMAGIERDRMTIEQEEEGVNLFLRIKN